MEDSMSRRSFLKASVATAISTHANAAMSAVNARQNNIGRFNVLHILSDQHQANQAGYEGNHQVITPNLNRLAARGMQFRRAYTQCPICTPSRISMLSGQYCHNHGYYGLVGPRPVVDLPSYLSHFRQYGYRTAAIGKIHTPDVPRNWLDGHCDVLEEVYRYHPKRPSIEYRDYLERRGLLSREDSIRFPEFPGVPQYDARPSDLPYEDSVEGWIVKRAIHFLDGIGSDRFCMQVSFPRPHENLTPDRRFWDLYSDKLELPATLYADDSQRPPQFRADVEMLKRMKWLFEPKTFEAGCRRIWRGYLACITQIDYAVGQLIAYLSSSGRLKDTIIVYGSDHGGYMGTFGCLEKVPGICSEAVTRVPYLWSVPSVTPVGSLCHELVENVDIAPTITSLCDLPPMQTSDGKDIRELLQGGSKPVREVAVTEFPWSKSLRWRQWEFVHFQREMFGGADVGELYDLVNDPLEKVNLYDNPAYQSVVHECRRRLCEWLISSTRFVTASPPPPGALWSQTVADGKESNQVGIIERVRRGALNYI